MPLLFYAVGYLKLFDEKKRTMARRDAGWTLAIAIVIGLPFILIGDANFFGEDGFLFNLISLSSALAGFYVAALVAAATLARGSDLDNVILVGKIYRLEKKDADWVPDALSRREYVCAMFGYLSFLAFVLSIGANYAISIGQSASLGTMFSGEILGSGYTYGIVAGWFIISIFSVVVSHLFVVTGYGLYYLISRLYQQAPKVIASNNKKEAA